MNFYLSPKVGDLFFYHFLPLETPKHVPPYALQLDAHYTPVLSQFTLRTEEGGLGYDSMNKGKGCWSLSSTSLSSLSSEIAMANSFTKLLYFSISMTFTLSILEIHSLILGSICFFLPVLSLSTF